MLKLLKNESDMTVTENGGKAYCSSGSDCLDLFFKAGGMRNADESAIRAAVARAYAENPDKTMKIIFFARDVRGGLGERRFFRTAITYLASYAAESVKKNIPLIAEYGRYDDLCVLLDTPCADAAVNEIKARLDADTAAMKAGKPVSLLAKWLPSVNTSSAKTVGQARVLCKKLHMSEKSYRHTLSALRKYTDIIENRLRVCDYTFDYSKQTAGSMFKYRNAFIRNDRERYMQFLETVLKGEAELKAGTLYPYEIIRRTLEESLTEEQRLSLDVSWRSLADYGSDEENAIAVVDGSGSMTWGDEGAVRPIDAALSLGIYFAEHNKGAFANHFITFSSRPRLIEIKGEDITAKAHYCSSFNECSNTNLEATFDLILRTAVNNSLSAEELPARMYIISDMEFDACAVGGNSMPMFAAMKKKYAAHGYKLPDVVFWNVCSRHSHIPVRMTDTGAALVSGFSPVIFGMVMSGDVTPEKVMESMIYSERYAPVSA